MSLSGNTIFTSYILVSTSGYSNSIHCNYIKSMQLVTDPSLLQIVLNFTNIDDFKFLGSVASGTGYTANKILALVQIVANSGYTTMAEIKPIAAKWKIFDVTSGITASGYVIGAPLRPIDLTNQAFSVSLKNYDTFQTYNLIDYLPTYPTKQSNNDNNLCFGDETFFLGNVTSDIKAIAYTTDISLLLELNNFNSSTNATWNSELDKVSISEIGVYDANKNLVGIGKLNNPIQKDNSIARTIVFDIDF